jgi:phage baseplate assembly protein W
MARLTRAQTLIGTNRKTEYFSDFVTSFAKTPVGDQLSRVVNEKSIFQSLKNLILTNLGERPFQPFIGSDVYRMLFENKYPEDLSDIEFYIQNTIENNEKRVNLIGVEVTSGENEHEIKVLIVFNTINNPEETTFEYVLKRVR